MGIGIALSNADRTIMWRTIDTGLTTIGRNSECDLCIPDNEVPPMLAVLRNDGDTLTLINRNDDGTSVGNQIIKEEYRLGDGDSIKIGPITGTIHYQEDKEKSTKNMSTRTLSQNIISREQNNDEIHAWLSVPEVFPGEIFTIDTQGIGIGSDTSNDIVLTDPYVSSFHARLTIINNRVIVRDLGSRNGVFVGDRKVLEGEVPSGVQLRLGRTILLITSGSANEETINRSVRDTRPLIGKSKIMDDLRERIHRVAVASAPVLITGDTGTGKEVVARLIAALSPRVTKNFHAINCGALGRSLIESELFGHEKGAFTGAIARKIGAFEAANGGTLFLDEIGELPIELQPQLLRVLETGEVRRVGAVDSFKVDVRLLAATNRGLEQEIEFGNFREDLYHRLHVLVLKLPNLQQRKEDIPELTQHFIIELTPPGEQLKITEKAIAKLIEHQWPGNVRELRNVIQRAVLMRRGDIIDDEDITFATSTLSSRVQTASATRKRTLQELEREAIIAELVRHNGSKTEAAVALGLSRSTIHRKIEEHGLDVRTILRNRGCP
ncbi:MAG: sigma 54-interacting transcriptional regulator [Deltaproteobacteria bacterium]|nr:sigma 54-interacting transcriptional regulator [Deltaproteobacteria bacterium]